jgi:hypothetical protein
MATGYAYLKREGEDAFEIEGHVELEAVRCSGCGAEYQIFAKGEHQNPEIVKGEYQYLRGTAEHEIHMDCPAFVPEGQPKRPGHTSMFKFLESGRVAT